MSDETASPPAVAKKRRLTWRRGLWALGVLVLLVIAADVALRVGAGLGNPVLYQADAACGYLPVPNQHLSRFGCRNDINAFSQRSAELSAKKQAGTERILFVGDSVTYGTTHVDQPEIFTAILARTLPQRLGTPVQVMNAATGAWAVGNEVGYLTSRGTFEADQVIFVLNTGDLVQPFNGGNLSPTSGYPAKKPLCALGELWVWYLSPRIFRRPPPHDAGSTASAEEATTDVQSILAQLDQARTICEKNGAPMKIVYSPCAGDRWQQGPLSPGAGQTAGMDPGPPDPLAHPAIRLRPGPGQGSLF